MRGTAFRDPKSYFHRYSNLSDEEAVETAVGDLGADQLVNLHENILPTRQRADLILKKGESHAGRGSVAAAAVDPARFPPILEPLTAAAHIRGSAGGFRLGAPSRALVKVAS